jgi:hypothetical protein
MQIYLEGDQLREARIIKMVYYTCFEARAM